MLTHARKKKKRLIVTLHYAFKIFLVLLRDTTSKAYSNRRFAATKRYEWWPFLVSLGKEGTLIRLIQIFDLSIPQKIKEKEQYAQLLSLGKETRIGHSNLRFE